MAQHTARPIAPEFVPAPRHSRAAHAVGDVDPADTVQHGVASAVTLARAEAAAQIRKRQLAALLEHSPQALVILDAGGRVREWNPAAVALLGWERSDVLGGLLARLVPPADTSGFARLWAELRSGGAPRTLLNGLLHRSGPPVPLETYVVPISNVDGSFAGVLGRLVPQSPGSGEAAAAEVDTTDSARPLQDPPRGALELDDLTGLPGRRWLQRRLAAPLPDGHQRALAVLDVDAFALVNQGYGAEAGDDVLRVLATRLVGVCDTGDLGRWQADEFVCIIDAPDASAELDAVVARLARATSEPFLIGDDHVRLTVSAGLATSERVPLSQLFRSAATALGSAKARGRDRAVWFDASDAVPAEASGLRLANDLQRGIAGGELRLHFQPIVDLATDEPVGVEALVRWERPGVGLLAPGSFIEVAERTGQIVALGEWVVGQACAAAVHLATRRGAPLRVSINVSARQLSDPGLVRMLREAFARTDCDPGSIGIEVTETAVLHDISAATVVLEDIKALGVMLDLDDFGTGYSSLLYLKHFPVDRIKIDRSFVAGLGTDVADTAIVASTIGLAHSVGLSAIAEGVETPQQLTLLRQMGCDFAQGYLLSRPLPQDLVERWLREHVPSPLLVREASSPPSGDVTMLSREAIADQRDTAGDQRDDVADAREHAGDRRDAAGERRDNAGDERDLDADVRDQAGDERDRAGDQRDVVADTRDRVADERDRAADQRDEDAVTHLGHLKDTAPDEQSKAVQEVLELSATARQEAAADRSLALQDRGVDAGARMQAERDREAASTDRGAGAEQRVHADLDRTRARADRKASARDRRAVPAGAPSRALAADVGLARLRREVAAATRVRHPLSVARLVLSGADGGDQVRADACLALVADGLAAAATEGAFTVRLGSHEMVCVLPGTPARAVTEQISVLAAAASGPPLSRDVTIGVAELTGRETVEELLARADPAWRAP